MTKLIIGVYLFLMLIIGIKSLKRIKSIEAFFVALRKGSTPFVTGSLVATIIGGSSTIGMAGLGFKNGISGAWWLLVGSIGLIILAFSIAKKVQKEKVYTLPELLEKQYDSKVKFAASIIIVSAWMGIIAGQIIAAGKILSLLFPADASTLMITATFVFIIYTMLGGQISILRTDTIQAIILIFAIIITVPLAIKAAGGISGIQKAYGMINPFSFPTGGKINYSYIFTLLFLVGSSYLVGPDIYSRLFCAKDKKVARNSIFFTALLLIPIAFFITIIGITAKAIAPNIAAEQSFPMIVTKVIPTGLNGLVLVGLLSAVMSSADTCLLTSSVIITEDLLGCVIKKENEKITLFISRLTILIIGSIALIISLKMGGVIKTLLLGYTVYSAGLVAPAFLGFYKKRLRLNSSGATASIVGGGGLSLFLKLYHPIPLAGLISMGVGIILLFLISWIKK